MLGDPFIVRCEVAEPVNEVLVAMAGLAVVEDLFDFEYVARFWPVLLIAAGAYLLAGRFLHAPAEKRVSHE